MATLGVAITLVLSLFLPTLLAEVPCPARCSSCTSQEAICSERSLTAPPRLYPETTRIINLDGNHIRVIGSRSFNNRDSVEMLKMNGNKIVALRADAFRAFPNLLTLDLSDNRISRIHRRALRRIPSLRTLSLKSNRIRTVANIFQHLGELRQLNLADNNIRNIGRNDLAALTQLHNLDLRDNQISSIHARAFQNLNVLRYLFLNNNPLASLPAMQFGSQVLQLVDLSHCVLTTVPGPFPASVADLRLGNNKIRQVNHTDFRNVTDLQMVALNDNDLHFLADGTFSHMPELKEVWLRANKLVYIPRNLPNSVRKLYIDYNNIQMIETGLFSNQSYLEYLTVENNQIHTIMPNTFSNLRMLNTINLRGNQLRTLESETFKDLNSLATLMLSNNPLARIEAGAFQNLGNLTQLFLSYIIQEDFELEGNFLSSMLRLRSLNLMNSPGLVDDLMAMIDDPAVTNVPLQSLTHLDLSYNTLEWVSPRVRNVFPNLLAIPLDGNPLRCSQNLKWLKDWMDTGAVSVQNYGELVCESPFRLKGRELRSLRDDEWAAEDEVDVGATGVVVAGNNAQGDLAAVAPVANSRTPGEGRPKRKISKEERRRRRRERKGKGKRIKKNKKDRSGKKRRNKKDKGKRRRKRESDVEMNIVSEEMAAQMGLAL